MHTLRNIENESMEITAARSRGGGEEICLKEAHNVMFAQRLSREVNELSVLANCGPLQRASI